MTARSQVTTDVMFDPMRRRALQGATAVGVATGHYDAAALREAGADHVLETLEEELPLA